MRLLRKFTPRAGKLQRSQRWAVAVCLAVVLLLVNVTGCGGSTQVEDKPAPGQYVIDVTLSGGTGRADVESPADLTVTAEAMTARIVWSSPNYTYMEVDGVRYDPINDPIESGENSTFEIPVKLDTPVEVSAETVAMSRPHVVEYTLVFDSASITPR